jgi:hypothetical protein
VVPSRGADPRQTGAEHSAGTTPGHSTSPNHSPFVIESVLRESGQIIKG